jgi:sodium-independent sulfate anion transporter 11
VQEKHPGVYTNEAIAKVLSAVSGMVLLAIGLLRLGWIIEFIPYISISAFVTAAAITIMATQFPTLMGITGVNTRDAAYRVIIESLKGLPRTKLDAAIGLSSIVLLYCIRYLCTRMQLRDPARQKTWAILSSLRLTFAMLVYTFISWLVNRNRREAPAFRIVGHIERGECTFHCFLGTI